MNAEVLGISVDSPYCHQAFAEKMGYYFPLLSDFNRKVIPRYGVEMADLHGLERVAKRSVFVVDQSGIVRYRWISEDPSKLPNLEEVLQEIRGISSKKNEAA